MSSGSFSDGGNGGGAFPRSSQESSSLSFSVSSSVVSNATGGTATATATATATVSASALASSRRKSSKPNATGRTINHAGIMETLTSSFSGIDNSNNSNSNNDNNDNNNNNNSGEFAAPRTREVLGKDEGKHALQFLEGEDRQLRLRSGNQRKAVAPHWDHGWNKRRNDNSDVYDGLSRRHQGKKRGGRYDNYDKNDNDDNDPTRAHTIRSMVCGLRRWICGSREDEESHDRKAGVPTLILHATQFLHGEDPYTIRFRIKTVHGLWIASLWYALATDAFAWAAESSSFSASSWERVFAWVNLGIWTVLVLELIVEIFVRPDRWQWLIRSEDAWSPSTARYLGGIHLFIESISLALWLPEVLCLVLRAWSNAASVSGSCLDQSCRLPMDCWESYVSFVVGPTVGNAFYGRMWYGVRRFRVFGLVRHWRNAWLERAFGNEHHVFGNHPDPHQQLHFHFHRSLSQSPTRSKSAIEYGGNEDQPENDDNPSPSIQRYRHGSRSVQHAPAKGDRRNEAMASHIETALMTVNSHRTLFLFCCLTAFFPVLFLLDQEAVIDPSGQELIQLLQAINIQSGDNRWLGNETDIASASSSAPASIEETLGCEYLMDSVEAWTKASSVRFRFHDPLPNGTISSVSRFLIGLTIRPARCAEQFQNTTVGTLTFTLSEKCPEWALPSETEQGNALVPNSGCIVGTIANRLWSTGISPGSIVTYRDLDHNDTWGVSALYNEAETIANSAKYSLILQLLLPTLIIAYVRFLRRDSIHLVLRSLRSMLRIVERYATNPLVPMEETEPMVQPRKNSSTRSSDWVDSDEEQRSDKSVPSRESVHRNDKNDGEDDDTTMGSTYETEQLVTAVSKIANLLRKCWGVAGADIISTNLAVRNGDFNVFNPTVPGKNVFALFAFAKIKDFDHALKRLGGDIMILINDVADVVHGDVYRWALGDSGQCNKNLGASFFFVFKIGFVREVVEKLEEATRVVFSTANGTKKANGSHRNKIGNLQQQQRVSNLLSSADARQSSSLPRSFHHQHKSNHPSRTAPSFVTGLQRKLHGEKDVAMKAMAEAMRLPLKQIPGISAFADRAVIAMLKSFAGVHRDTQLRAWSRDIRLRGGIDGTWSVDMIFGMDAGWAVEGAVGSEYKIDATYLSPHVNMASRMMSACKQYGVTILVSQAVQELLSESGKNKFRNVDRVTVKGSSTIQKIYTYDARSKGTNFSFHSVSDEQADHHAMNYEPSIWNDDPDLKAMRHHITKDFEVEFREGMKHYYEGNWSTAIQHLGKANKIMVDTSLSKGDVHDVFRDGETETDHPDRDAFYLNNDVSDPPCRYLINFMKSKGSKSPNDWDGWHPLMSK